MSSPVEIASSLSFTLVATLGMKLPLAICDLSSVETLEPKRTSLVKNFLRGHSGSELTMYYVRYKLLLQSTNSTSLK